MNKMTAWMKGLLLLTLMVGGQAGAEVETVTYLHTDHLGSPIMGRDASGNTVFREEYGPWGQQLSATTPSDDVTYTGHANEGDIGLTYMKARWYDPAVGRFLSPDPVTFDGGGAGHLNRYVYAGNSPFANVDPDGESALAAFGGVIHESGQALQGNGFDGGSVLGALVDGYNGEGGGIGQALFDDATSFIPAGVAAGTLIKAGRLFKASKAAKGAGTGAESAANGLRLNKSLASQAQMSEAGTAMAGAGTRVRFKDSQRVAREHGGNAADWAKKTSSSHTARDGTRFETHWVENMRTGQRGEFKTKFPGGG